jgi:hypothetical protein
MSSSTPAATHQRLATRRLFLNWRLVSAGGWSTSLILANFVVWLILADPSGSAAASDGWDHCGTGQE